MAFTKENFSPEKKSQEELLDKDYVSVNSSKGSKKQIFRSFFIEYSLIRKSKLWSCWIVGWFS